MRHTTRRAYRIPVARSLSSTASQAWTGRTRMSSRRTHRLVHSRHSLEAGPGPAPSGQASTPTWSELTRRRSVCPLSSPHFPRFLVAPVVSPPRRLTEAPLRGVGPQGRTPVLFLVGYRRVRPIPYQGVGRNDGPILSPVERLHPPELGDALALSDLGNIDAALGVDADAVAV